MLSPVLTGEDDLAGEGELGWRPGATVCCCWEWALEGDVLPRSSTAQFLLEVPPEPALGTVSSSQCSDMYNQG